ncbi:MAG TPA: antitoxin family protein [Blastocatellia bacterium]|nr:antitoxin family protein [Blastocatellia bacterium]HMV84858.1 antitoxin family protein [Blastocatellia bacterium]HMX30542.1 antitoxin family protein [Blastocatellia bacterium]HMZ22343.1 antitoxin family protein [Blastocatellia bacterium]HNG34134.1 antitoxin family protein [Blastocatellia bacterium]
MQQTVEAIFENGIFRVIDPSPLHLTEGQKVKLMVGEAKLSADEILALAAKVYEGLSENDIEEIERIALDRRDFFGEHKP